MRENERTRTNTYTPLVFLVMVYEKQIEVEHRAKQLYPVRPPFPVDHGVGHAEPDERERQTMAIILYLLTCSIKKTIVDANSNFWRGRGRV